MRMTTTRTKTESTDWVRSGAHADYHGVIGGPIALYATKIRDVSELNGRPVAFLEGKAGCVAVDALTPAKSVIRLRGWDPEANRMLYHTVGDQYWYTKDLQHMNWAAPYKAVRRLKLMRFSGRRDDYGNEIWESDIVFAKLSRRHAGGNFAVEWSDPSASFYVYASQLSHVNKIQVVGNLYENPELLEAQS
jgi:hypothetical protein